MSLYVSVSISSVNTSFEYMQRYGDKLTLFSFFTLYPYVSNIIDDTKEVLPTLSKQN